MSYEAKLKKSLDDMIHRLYLNKDDYCKNPGRDFSRNKKIGFEETIKLLISMEGGTLNTELLHEYDFSPGTPTASAFVQQRGKLREEAFIDLFNMFNKQYPYTKKYRGYRLIACDGTDMNIYNNPHDAETRYQAKPNAEGYNMIHMDACYDLCNRRYTDIILSPGQSFDEVGAMVEMMDRYNGARKTIFIADRGYESYNIFAHANENNLKFLIRVKDKNSTGMLKGYKLPDTEEFDIDVHRIFTRGWTKDHLSHPEIYKLLPKASRFDYVKNTRDDYKMGFRILRFRISDDLYECVITNLSRGEFNINEVKKLYAMRWGIETSFRELKYAIGITAFHARKIEYIRQEVYARLIMYNFCELVTTHTIVRTKNTKHTYQLNYTMAIVLCRKYMKTKPHEPPIEIERLLQRYILPVRPGRKDRRKVIKNQPAVSFTYRVAA